MIGYALIIGLIVFSGVLTMRDYFFMWPARSDVREVYRSDLAAAARWIEEQPGDLGGRNSANTSRLVSLCRESGKPTYHVEVVDEIRSEWLKGANRVGLTAGASTPGWVIDAVLKRLQAEGNT